MRLSMECYILTVNTGWSFYTENFCQVYTSQVCGKTKLGWMSGPVHSLLISWIFYKSKILCASGPLQDHKDHHFFGRPLLSYVVLIRTSWEPWKASMFTYRNCIFSEVVEILLSIRICGFQMPVTSKPFIQLGWNFFAYTKSRPFSQFLFVI